MRQKPRPRTEGILTKEFLFAVAVDGAIISVATILAFHMGLNAGGAAMGSTMAFSVLCLSRLFHGFNCKAERALLLSRDFWNNPTMLLAFAVGALLLFAALLVPVLQPLMQVAVLPGKMLGAVVGLPFASMLLIQLLKVVLNRK